MAELGDSLRELTRNNFKFAWRPEHIEIVDDVKKEITRSLIFRYYDPSKPLSLLRDVSFKDLGEVLLQDHQPIYFASKSLQAYQKECVATELESLAAV